MRNEKRGTRNEKRGTRKEERGRRKAVIKREQSDACIGYAEREQARCETSTRNEEGKISYV